MKVVLIDDEPECNDALRLMLQKYCPTIQIVAICTTPQEGIIQIRQHQPDLVFLDIQMEGMSGIEMLLRLQPLNFEVIFVTGHSEYAQRAIRLSALDYIEKPPVVEDIIAAVLRATQVLHKKEIQSRYETFFHNMMRRQNNLVPNRIALITSTNALEYIDTHMILYIEADRAYCSFHLMDARTIMASRPMGIYEDLLKDAHFMRIHRSYLVNIEHIRFFLKSDEQVQLVNGMRLPVSKAEKENLLHRLSNI